MGYIYYSSVGLIGTTKAGKTSLLRFLKGEEFNKILSATSSVDNKWYIWEDCPTLVKFGDKKYRVYDTAGSKANELQYHGIKPQILILVVDGSLQYNSEHDIREWSNSGSRLISAVSALKEQNVREAHILIVATRVAEPSDETKRIILERLNLKPEYFLDIINPQVENELPKVFTVDLEKKDGNCNTDFKKFIENFAEN